MLRSNESIYPRGTKIRPLTTKENVGNDFLEDNKTFDLNFYQLDDNAVLYYLSGLRESGVYNVCGCISVCLQSPEADDISEIAEIDASKLRFTILNIGISRRFKGFFLDKLLLFLVVVKTCSEQYPCIYVDHPALSAIDFFIELGFAPDQSTASTDASSYWSNENFKIDREWFAFLFEEEDRHRDILLQHITAFQKLHTPTGAERHHCDWFCDSSRLYGHLRAKVKKIFEFYPPS
ncbi:hypothetical protein [Candidatus Sororendozoicomonas aggregata]|uniref:hypothetical protein n=1 Tax=Candidatus Sororendozoicomonas aggregata TaxID=3073239 RepID=UPI002ED273BB